jgi:Zn-dependent protease
MATQTAEPKFQGSFRLMNIAGIQITMDASWFVICILVVLSLSMGYFPRQFPAQSPATYWVAGLLATLLFFGSILVHELAHALMARRAGMHTPEITLFIFGGVARLAAEARDARTEFRIAIVGPLTSFALALLFWGLNQALETDEPSLLGAVLSYLTWINVAVGIFNLIPGFPLDGGRVLRAFLATVWVLDDGHQNGLRHWQGLCACPHVLWWRADLHRLAARRPVAHLHWHVSAWHGRRWL